MELKEDSPRRLIAPLSCGKRFPASLFPLFRCKQNVKKPVPARLLPCPKVCEAELTDL